MLIVKDLPARANLTRLPNPPLLPATPAAPPAALKAAALWRDRPAVVLVLRQGGY